jgi:PII-like signaling protein
MINSKTSTLRIYGGNTDKINGAPLYETILYSAKKVGMAGATVLKGAMGFGASSIVHSSKIFAISDDLPVIIEIVDLDERIIAFIEVIKPYLENPKFGMLITKHSVDVIHYSHSKTKD